MAARRDSAHRSAWTAPADAQLTTTITPTSRRVMLFGLRRSGRSGSTPRGNLSGERSDCALRPTTSRRKLQRCHGFTFIRACTHKIAIGDGDLIKSALAHFADQVGHSPRSEKCHPRPNAPQRTVAGAKRRHLTRGSAIVRGLIPDGFILSVEFFPVCRKGHTFRHSPQPTDGVRRHLRRAWRFTTVIWDRTDRNAAPAPL